MRSPLIRSSYGEIYSSISNAADWLTDHGLRVEPTRIGEYKRSFEKILSLHKDGNFNDNEKQKIFKKYINLVHEVQELVYIYNGLSPLITSELSTRFQMFVKGPASYTEENIKSSSNVARNIAFELLVAAKFASAGLKIDFGTKADLRINLEDFTVYVECKRPQSSHQINSNIKGALSQLEERYKSHDGAKNPRGIIAISLTKILNPDQEILVARNTESLHSTTEKMLDRFHNDYKSKWFLPRDTKSIGAMIYFSVPTSVEDENIIAHSHQIDFTNCCDPKCDDMRLIRNIAKQVEAAGIANN